MQHLIQQYWDTSDPECRKIQQLGKKIFPDQHDDEIVIRILPGSWTSYASLYAVIIAGWTLAILVSALSFVVGSSVQSALTTTLIATMVMAMIDAVIMLRVTNKSLSNVVLTSKRIVVLDFYGVYSDNSDSITFDNLNDCIHSQKGFMSVVNSGKLVLKLASGEQRIFRHVHKPRESVTLITRIQELYKQHGGRVFIGNIFVQSDGLEQQTGEKIIANVLTAKRNFKPLIEHLPPSSLPPQ